MDVPIMLLTNLSQSTGLCNGTRLIVLDLADCVVKAVIITGSHVGDVIYIPRIELIEQEKIIGHSFLYDDNFQYMCLML
jgi:ATP-dependent DNA helicase PIF1